LVDDDGFERAFGGTKFKAELLLQDREERWIRRVGGLLRRPFDKEVVGAFEAGAVLDGTASVAAQRGGDVGHRHVRSSHAGARSIDVCAHGGGASRQWLV